MKKLGYLLNGYNGYQKIFSMLSQRTQSYTLLKDSINLFYRMSWKKIIELDSEEETKQRLKKKMHISHMLMCLLAPSRMNIEIISPLH